MDKYNLRKVTKPTARKMYNAGLPVWLVPCNMRPPQLTEDPIYGWDMSCRICNSESDGDFDKTVNAFEYYNCCPETGRYSHFYVLDVPFEPGKGLCVGFFDITSLEKELGRTAKSLMDVSGLTGYLCLPAFEAGKVIGYKAYVYAERKQP